MADKKGAKSDRDPKKALSKTQMYTELATLAGDAGLTRKQVAAVFDALTTLVHKELGKKGPGLFSMPGMLKLKRITKPATKGGMRPNPFKPGEMMEVKAKPARNVVKALPLKQLKESIK